MFPHLALIRQLFQPFARPPLAQDEAYLARAQDMADLERRMRQLDRGERDAPLPPVRGVFSH